MRKSWVRAAVVLAGASFVLAAACGGESVNNPDPRLIAGGGAGDGAVKGALHVYVIDGLAGTPITGASVRVGTSADTAPLVGTSDTAGLASFKDGKLEGPQTVTVTATNYAASTWVGANSANLTIPLEPNQVAAPAKAKATGTIQGWDARPAPAQNHLLLAYIGYSFVEPFDAPENSIAQDTQTVAGLTLPKNICLKVANQSVCNWSLNTRTGKQNHWAVVIDVDTKGTLGDQSDDVYTVVDYAFLMDQNLAANEEKTGESLVPVGAGGLTDATVALQAAPTGMDSVAGLPLIKTGEAGDIVLVFAPFGPNKLTQKVPTLAGPLAAATYDFIAHAKADATTDYPQSTILKRGVTLGATVDFGAWLAQPTSFSATGGTYSFAPATGASLHTVKFLQTGASSTTIAWNVGLLDGSTSFSLPSLSPSPLPVGAVEMRVEALKVPTFDPASFSVDTLKDAASQHSAGQLSFTR